MIRPLGISDLPRLVLQSGKLDNQAVPRDVLVSRHVSNLRFRSLIRQWFAPGDSFHSWVCVEDNKLRGLVSAKERWGHRVWDIDRLLFDEVDQDKCLAMFETVSNSAANQGVPKIFLRLSQDSPMLQVATTVGFNAYQQEKLYSSRGVSSGPLAADGGYRFLPCTEVEAQNLFHLYSQIVPAAIRSVEGMTLKEWQSCQEYKSGMAHQLTCWFGDELIGWIKITLYKRSGIVDLIAKPNHIEPVLDFSLSCLGHKKYANYLVPAYQSDLAALLNVRKFEPAGDYISLVKETAGRIRQPALAPVKA